MQQDRNKHRETEDTENTDLVVLIVTSGGGWRVSASSCHLLTRVARMGRGVARTNNASLWLFEGERFAPRFLITVSQCFNIAVGFPIQKKQRNTENTDPVFCPFYKGQAARHFGLLLPISED